MGVTPGSFFKPGKNLSVLGPAFNSLFGAKGLPSLLGLNILQNGEPLIGFTSPELTPFPFETQNFPPKLNAV